MAEENSQWTVTVRRDLNDPRADAVKISRRGNLPLVRIEIDVPGLGSSASFSTRADLRADGERRVCPLYPPKSGHSARRLALRANSDICSFACTSIHLSNNCSCLDCLPVDKPQ